MADCNFLENCPFFSTPEMVDRPHLIDYLKTVYCRSDFQNCCRYRIAAALGCEHIPSLMMPDQMEWARQILKESHHETDSPHSR